MGICGYDGDSASIYPHLNFVANIHSSPPSHSRLTVRNSGNIPLRAIDIMSDTQHDATPMSEFYPIQERPCKINILTFAKTRLLRRIMLQSVYIVIILIASRFATSNITGTGIEGHN